MHAAALWWHAHLCRTCMYFFAGNTASLLIKISLELDLQVCFQLACTTYTDAWGNPALFYPLSALPEVLAVLILSWQSLVPIITHAITGFGSTAAGPFAAAVSPVVPVQPHSAYLDSLGASNQQSMANSSLPGSSVEGYSQQAYCYPYLDHTQGFQPQPYQNSRQGQRQSQGITQQPYLQGRQGLGPEVHRNSGQRQGQYEGSNQQPYLQEGLHLTGHGRHEAPYQSSGYSQNTLLWQPSFHVQHAAPRQS